MSRMPEDIAELSRRLGQQAAQGSLDADGRARLEAYLREHPEAAADTEWDRAFAERLDEKVRAMPAMPGWARTVQHLERARVSRAPGVLDRIGEWLRQTFGVALNAQALAAALVLAQAGVIGVMLYQDRVTEEAVRSGAQDATPRGPLLRVAFKEDVREADFRRALAEIGGEIVGGPGQIGVYLVRVRAGDLAQAAERLRASGVAQLVEVFEAKP